MSEPLRIALVGATGLIGTEVIKLTLGREDVRLVAVARREFALPPELKDMVRGMSESGTPAVLPDLSQGLKGLPGLGGGSAPPGLGGRPTLPGLGGQSFRGFPGGMKKK